MQRAARKAEAVRDGAILTSSRGRLRAAPTHELGRPCTVLVLAAVPYAAAAGRREKQVLGENLSRGVQDFICHEGVQGG